MDDEYEDDEDLMALTPQLASEYRVLKNANAQRDKAMEENYYKPQREMWKKQEDELRARRTGPGFSEKMYALSAALAQPTKYRGLGGMMANVAPVLLQQQQAQREAEEAKREMLMKYGLKTGEIDLEKKKAEIEAAQELAKQRFGAMKSMFAPRFVPGPYGGGTYVYPGQASTPANVARPQSEAEYNALPSGSLYIGPTGHTMRKP